MSGVMLGFLSKLKIPSHACNHVILRHRNDRCFASTRRLFLFVKSCQRLKPKEANPIGASEN